CCDTFTPRVSHRTTQHMQREEELQSLDAEKEMLQSTLRVLEAEEQTLLAELEARRRQAAEINRAGGGHDVETGAVLTSIEAKASSTAQARVAKEGLRRWELDSSQRDLRALQSGVIGQHDYADNADGADVDARPVKS